MLSAARFPRLYAMPKGSLRLSNAPKPIAPPRKRQPRQSEDEGADSWLIRPVGKLFKQFQIRIWLGGFLGGKSVNCGDYPTQQQAEAVRDALLALLQVPRPARSGWANGLNPLMIWERARDLSGGKLLPLWVKRVRGKDGPRYTAKTSIGGAKLVGKTHKTPDAAYREVERMVRGVVGKGSAPGKEASSPGRRVRLSEAVRRWRERLGA